MGNYCTCNDKLDIDGEVRTDPVSDFLIRPARLHG